MEDIPAIAATILASVGAAGAIILALSSWLGRVWATRIADRERAQFAQDLESFRAELSELASHRQDALMRRRDVYAKLAASMRILLGRGRLATDAQKDEFLKAYDHSCLWAAEDVAESLGQLLDGIAANVRSPGAVDQDDLQARYRACMLAMRRDAGFPDTTLQYRVVSF